MHQFTCQNIDQCEATLVLERDQNGDQALSEIEQMIFTGSTTLVAFKLAITRACRTEIRLTET